MTDQKEHSYHIMVFKGMQLIKNSYFTAIDFESTGAVRGKTDVPVQVGLAQWDPKRKHGEHFVSYIDAEMPISRQARKVHGIRDEEIIDAPKLILLWPKLKTFLADRVVVAHGKGTEQRFLRAFPAHGFGPWIDTLLLYRAAFPNLENHSLSFLCEHFQLGGLANQLAPNRKWHDALYDSIASLLLLEHLINSFHLAESPLETLLHPDTSTWHRLRR